MSQTPLRVLHLVPNLGIGGGGRSALTVAMLGAADGEEHRIASLLPSAPSMVEAAAEAGVALLDAPGASDLDDAIADADLVQLTFWHTPELYELLERELPPMRLLLWSVVAGTTAPQIVPPELAAAADLAVASSTMWPDAVRARGGDAGRMLTIPTIDGWDRVEGVRRSSRNGFNVGYVGTVGFVKLEPAFVAACADVDVPEARFIVCGGGDAVRALPREAAERGLAERFEFLGHRREIASVLADLDVFGYPLREGTYASCDIALKEAMYAGVPPVVLPRGGAEEAVEDGRTGIVAQDLDAYARAIERLHRDPVERQRMGEAAREEAARRWSPEVVRPRWAEAYARTLAEPKRRRPAILPAPAPSEQRGAARFVRGLGEAAGPLADGVDGIGAAAAAADEWIAACSPVVGLTGGGLLDYRRSYPLDALLSLWTGLYLQRQGRPALAAGLLTEARRLGSPEARLKPHLVGALGA